MMSLIFISILNASSVALPPEAQIQNKESLVQMLRSPLADLRINALDRLAELRYQDTVHDVAALLRDNNGQVRFHAIRALTRLGSQEALDALNAQSNVESDPYLKSELRRGRKTIEDQMKAEMEKSAAGSNSKTSGR